MNRTFFTCGIPLKENNTKFMTNEVGQIISLVHSNCKEISSEEVKKKIAEVRCNDCKNLEEHLDNCGECKQEFCYDCLGLIENNLYCEPCYRKILKVDPNDAIVRHFITSNPYKNGQRVVNQKYTNFYWEVRKTDEILNTNKVTRKK